MAKQTKEPLMVGSPMQWGDAKGMIQDAVVENLAFLRESGNVGNDQLLLTAAIMTLASVTLFNRFA
jgi:hypothetical protein